MMDPIFDKYKNERGVIIGDYATIEAFVDYDAQYEWSTDDEYSSSDVSDDPVEDVPPVYVSVSRAVCPLQWERGNLIRGSPKSTLLPCSAIEEMGNQVVLEMDMSGWEMHDNDKLTLSHVFKPMAMFRYKRGTTEYKEYDYGLFGEITMTCDGSKWRVTLPIEYLL